MHHHSGQTKRERCLLDWEINGTRDADGTIGNLIIQHGTAEDNENEIPCNSPRGCHAPLPDNGCKCGSTAAGDGGQW